MREFKSAVRCAGLLGTLFGLGILLSFGCQNSNPSDNSESNAKTGSTNQDSSPSSASQNQPNDSEVGTTDSDLASKQNSGNGEPESKMGEKKLTESDSSDSNSNQTVPEENSADNTRIDLSPPANLRKKPGNESADDTDAEDNLDLDVEDLSQSDDLDDYYEEYVEDPIVKDSKLPPVDDHWIRIHETAEIWIDRKNNKAIVGGRICLRRGPLEMFACPEHMKEHESVVAVKSSARLVHTALNAVGAKEGSPVKYTPEYIPVSGSKVKIEVTWLENGKAKTIDAQKMIRNMESKENLDTNWVFGGSITERDPNTGQVLYGGDDGMLICVSNFTIATLDIPIESSDLEGNWLFEADTDNIPQRGTRVLVTLTPMLEKENSDGDKDSNESKSKGEDSPTNSTDKYVNDDGTSAKKDDD